MAILTGTTKTRFPDFTDPNSGAGVIFSRLQEKAINFIRQNAETAENSFVEDGIQNIPGFSSQSESYSSFKQPSTRRIITQRAQATVFIKKRMFASLRNNFDIRFLGENEKLFLKASKLLFDKKSQDLSYYESLLNLESIFKNDGFVNIDAITDKTLDSFFEAVKIMDPSLAKQSQRALGQEFITDPALSPYSRIILQLLRLKELNQKSKGNRLTTWIYDPKNPDTVGIGEGVGVIELNLVTTISTKTSLKPGEGTATLTIEDPYRIMTITESDIEVALKQALAEKSSSRKASQFVSEGLLSRAETLDRELNALRRSRRVSEINFEFLLGSTQATGTFVDTGEDFDKNSVHTLSDFPPGESARAIQIMSLMEEYQTGLQNTAVLLTKINETYNDVRQRLRNEFVGHTLIQQMDLVHIFMNSRTRDSTPLYDGRLDEQSALIGSRSRLNDFLDASSIELERQQIAPEVPPELYYALRDKSVFRQDGVQVFCGPVTSVSTSYQASDGKFSISVQCKDNTEFLKMGRINISPSLAQPGGMLEDPLTPFELEVDAGTGLISKTPSLSKENKNRLKYLKFDDGLRAGKKVRSEDDIHQDKETGGSVLVYQHVPGFVYKWKSGIIAETLNVNIQKPLSGIGPTLSDVTDQYSVTVANNPFGGLDAADVISILVTGRPHNYATFLKHALDIGTFSIDNTNQSKFYFNYLFDFLERGSGLLGDFVPAVADIIDPVKANQIFNEKRKIESFTSRIASLQRQLAEAEDKQRSKLNNQTFKDGLYTQINSLKTKLNEALRAGKNVAASTSEQDKLQVSFGTIGNEVHLQFDSEQLPEIRQRLKYQLKKKPEEVRYNQDKNFLVISDKYDSDFDIQSFARNLKNPDLFKSDYKTSFELCTESAQTMGFEFFADSQGNIVFRPPEYNKTPLSLLIRLLELSRIDNVAHIPPYLDSLFKTRLEVVKQQIKLNELKTLESFVLLGMVSATFDIRDLPDDITLSLKVQGDGATWGLDETALMIEVSKGDIFNLEEQEALRRSTSLLADEGTEISSVAKLLITVRNGIYAEEGRPDKIKESPDQSDITKAAQELEKYNTASDVNGSLNRLNKTNEIARLVSERQLLGKTYKAIAANFKNFNMKQGELKKSDVPNLTSAGADLSVFPKFMEDLIENDLKNEDGFRSGKRYIIYDDVIVKMEFSVNSPEFTRIDVTGNQDFVSTDDQGSLGGVPKVFWAGAVDFDTWRQFGYRPGQSIHRPDFNNAETQCAPYAIFKLQEQRRKIHQGSLDLMGNEHYQIGDVVYVNNRSMMYYVTGISHSFSFDDGKYTTRLELAYGRALGEYIPTTLDVIGKGILASQKNAFSNIKSNRSVVSANHIVPLETLFVSRYLELNSDKEDLIRDDFQNNDSNRNKVKNAIKKAASRINTATQGEVAIEVRTYYIDADTRDKSEIIGQWVYDMVTEFSKKDFEDAFAEKLSIKNVFLADPITLNPDDELSERDQKLRRFPTSQAWAGASKFVYTDGIPLPVNAIDLVFLTEKSPYGDQPPINIRGR